MKRRHLLLMALSLILTICMCFAFAGCDSCSDDEAPAKLSTPVVTIDDNGVATWLEVENASGYAYVIDDKPEVSTTQLSVNLADGQSVKVKAKGDGANYSDSDFSEIKTYNAPAKQPKKLASPEVTIAGDGTVTIGAVEHASKIVYVIGDGAETEYDASSKPVLTDGQTIKVTAKGDGTNYSDSDIVEKTHNATQPADVMTHAQFVAAEKATNVTVQGVVTAFVKTEKYGYNIYMQDSDGGYYVYGTTGDVAQTFAIGVTIKAVGAKDVYNGLHQVKNATVEITNATATQVTPVDVTDKVGNNDALLALQSSYVTVKGATITDVSINSEKNRTNVTLTVDGKTILFYIGGSQVVNSDQQSEISKSFNDNKGKTVDVTAIVSLFSNTAQLIPANATPLSDIKTTLEELDAPVVSVDQTTGKATWNEVANATRYVYKIGENGTETDAPANREVQLVKGDTIYVKAIGDGTTYGDSDWSIVKVWSNVDPDTLPALDAPATVTISEDGLTISWPQVAGAAGYKYAVGDGADVETIELSVTLDTALTAGQTVKVKAVGDLINNKDSEYKTATYVKKLEAPVVEIDDNGVVTVTADTNAVKVVYVIADGAETDYNADSKPTLTNGQKITVTAKGNGTAYADSDPVEKTYVALMTHAEFADAVKGAAVCVKGVVTAFKGTNVYFSDNDGGYYAYSVTEVPANLAVGMTVKVTGNKDEFNGLQQVGKGGTLEIVDAEIKTVTPVDITEKITNMTSLDELGAYQNMLVTVKGITVAAFDGNNFKFTLGTVEVSHYVGGKSQLIAPDDQAAYKQHFTDNDGNTADLTCIVSATKKDNVIVHQLIPATEKPLSNIHKVQLNAPSVEIDEDTGVATVTAAQTNGGDKLYYLIVGVDEEFKEYNKDDKPVVPYGKTIKVKAGDTTGKFDDSAEASVEFNVQQETLSAPTVTVGSTSGIVNVTATNEHTTGFVYTILNSDNTEVSDKVDLPYNEDDKPVLAEGQKIKVKAVGAGKWAESSYATYGPYHKTNKLGTPVLSIDRDGNVSWSATDGASFTYKVKAKDAADYGDPVTGVDKENRKAKLNNGETIQVQAIHKELTPEEIAAGQTQQEDSEWSEELKYLAPVKRTAPVITAFERPEGTADGKVLLKWTVEEGVEYKLSLNGAEPVQVENGEYELAIADYTSIELIACGSTGEPQAKGDYSNLFADSVASDEVKEAALSKYTTFYNEYKANFELNALAVVSLIVDNEEISFAANGSTYTDIAFTWSIKDGDKDYAILSDNVLTVITSNVTEGATITVTATVTGTIFSKPFGIEIKAGETATMSYPATTSSTNLVANQNNATKVRLDDTVFNVNGTINANSTNVALNKDGYIRLHKNSANTMTVTIEEGEAYKIGKFAITLKTGTQADLLVKVDNNEVATVENGIYLVNAKNFSLTCKSSSIAVDITKIDICYLAPELTDAEKAQKAVDALPDDFGYNVNGFTVSTIGRFDATITWSANNAAIAFTDNGDDTATATVTRGDADTDVVVTAKVSINGVEKEKPYPAVTVIAKPTGNTPTELATIDFSDSKSHIDDLKTNQYTGTHTGTVSGVSVTLVSFSNNSWAWNNVRCGRKSASTTASISCSNVTGKVSSIKITVDTNSKDLKASDTIKLIVLNGSSEVTSIDLLSQVGTSSFTTAKDIIADIPAEYQGANYTYKFEVSLASTGSNGSFQVSKIVLTGLAA